MHNKAEVLGHVGQKPKLASTSGGKSVCQFSVATTEKWNDEGGNKQERTEWHKIVVFGGQAEQCERYLDKGSLVFVEGKLQTREWEGRDGTKQRTTEIVAHTVKFVGPRPQQSSQPPAPRQQAPAQQQPNQPPEDDFPF